MSNRALIIDGNNFYNIAYWSAQKKHDNKFIPIRFFERLNEAYCVHKNDFKFLFIVWDSLVNNRKEKPKDFYEMMPYIKDVLTMRCIQQYEKDGFEGDDLIYSTVEMCKGKGYPITVASGDHDMYQLLSDTIDIYDPSTFSIVNYNIFKEKYKIDPFRWKYVKSMMKDISDNVRGVDGIGPKNAVDIIEKYGDLDSFYSSDMSKVSNSIKSKMVAISDGYDAKKSAYDSLKMVEFRKVEIPYPELAVITPEKINKSLYVENCDE